MRRTAARLLGLLCAALVAPEAALALDGEITHLSGAVIARRVDGATRILTMRSRVSEGDIIVTADSSYARIKWADGGEVVMRPGSQLKIEAYKYDESNPSGDNVVLGLLKGGLRSVTGLLGRRSPNSFNMATPTATIGIRGTHFGALVCNNDCSNITAPGGGPPANGLHVDVADGTIIVTTQVGSRDFRVGDFGYVQSISTLPVEIPAGQGTRVTLPSQALVQAIQGGSVGRGSDLECAIR
jgi:hypothetical protein